MVRILNQYVSRETVILVVAEFLTIVAALLLGMKLRYWDAPEGFELSTLLPNFALQALVVVVSFQVCSYYNEIYQTGTTTSRFRQLNRLVRSAAEACLILAVIYLLFPSLSSAEPAVFFSLLVSVGGFVTLTHLSVGYVWRSAVREERTLILGTGKQAMELAEEINRRNDLHLCVVGFLDASARPTRGALNGTSRGCVLGGFEGLEALARQYGVSRVIVAMEQRRGTLPVKELFRLRADGVKVEEGRAAMEALTGRVLLEGFQPGWLAFSDGFRRSRVSTALKRFGDLLLATLGLAVSSPLLVLTAAAIWISSGRPVLYRQVRVGLRGREFEVLKFRTMRTDAEADGKARWAVADDPRVTWLGRYLRKYRIDELPQFVNVLRGEMSLVGPRPERPEFVRKFRELTPYYDERHTLRPGVTGWAQVRYQYAGDMESGLRKLEYDLFYLKNMSLSLDCAIFLETVKTVLRGRGAN